MAKRLLKAEFAFGRRESVFRDLITLSCFRVAKPLSTNYFYGTSKLGNIFAQGNFYVSPSFRAPEENLGSFWSVSPAEVIRTIHSPIFGRHQRFSLWNRCVRSLCFCEMFSRRCEKVTVANIGNPTLVSTSNFQEKLQPLVLRVYRIKTLSTNLYQSQKKTLTEIEVPKRGPRKMTNVFVGRSH